MDCSLPGSSVCGLLQARILEWVAISLLQGIFLIQESNPGLLHCRQVLYWLSYKGSLRILEEKQTNKQKQTKRILEEAEGYWGWGGCYFHLQGNLPDPGVKLKPPASPAFSGGFFTAEPPGKPFFSSYYLLILVSFTGWQQIVLTRCVCLYVE